MTFENATEQKRVPRELVQIVEQYRLKLERATAQAILRWARATFGARLCATSSMTDAVVVHLLSENAPGTDVLFLDTGAHFAETLEYRDLLSRTFDVNPIDIAWKPGGSGSRWMREYKDDPDGCCNRRKVAPLRAALGGYEAWITGIRRAESSTRSSAPVMAWDEANQVVKIAPIVAWSDDDVSNYESAHNLPRHRLVDLGYTSIGCTPCTAMPGDADKRSGRWPGHAKNECGIHLAIPDGNGGAY